MCFLFLGACGQQTGSQKQAWDAAYRIGCRLSSKTHVLVAVCNMYVTLSSCPGPGWSPILQGSTATCRLDQPQLFASRRTVWKLSSYTATHVGSSLCSCESYNLEACCKRHHYPLTCTKEENIWWEAIFNVNPFKRLSISYSYLEHRW